MPVGPERSHPLQATAVKDRGSVWLRYTANNDQNDDEQKETR